MKFADRVKHVIKIDKKALNFSKYSQIIQQTIVDEGLKSFVFQINGCRVRSATKKKDPGEYPCRSAGRVEYESFTKAIYQQLQTQCNGCFPADHPDQCFVHGIFYR